MKRTPEEKQQLRKQKQEERMRRHVVTCPHCGKDVLDHMTECPFCKGELTPVGYKPVDERLIKKIRLICFLVGAAVFIGVVVYVLLKG
ncbi:MAG: hypothetical protein J6C93_00245 [Clostridia bacterium]|nr:hypothetical protein [Clostridia bacterium]